MKTISWDGPSLVESAAQVVKANCEGFRQTPHDNHEGKSERQKRKQDKMSRPWFRAH